jgi:hypothetical protein
VVAQRRGVGGVEDARGERAVLALEEAHDGVDGGLVGLAEGVALAVEDVVLPRGRAGSKALKEAKAARAVRAPKKGRPGRKPGRKAAEEKKELAD